MCFLDYPNRDRTWQAEEDVNDGLPRRFAARNDPLKMVAVIFEVHAIALGVSVEPTKFTRLHW